MEELLWTSIIAVVFAYFGYPLTLLLFKKKNYRKSNALVGEPVAILIAAANEEKRIVQKLENCAALDYSGALSVIVALDAPTDHTLMLTADWIRRNPRPNKKFFYLHIPSKKGKEGALKQAIDTCVKEKFVVFTDVATHLEPDTISQLMTNFADERVGAVDGMSSTSGLEGLYLRYENKVRELESSRGGLVGLGGCLFAVRAEIIRCQHLLLDGHSSIEGFSSTMQSDFRVALVTKTLGMVSILDRHAVAEFPDTVNSEKEFTRKHRTVVRGLNVLFNHFYLLDMYRYGIFSYQLACHKLLKWMVPFFMAIALVCNFVLAGDILYSILLLFHVTFYAAAWHGWKWPITFGKTCRVFGFFLMGNLAILKAFYSFMVKGEKFVSWEVTKR